MKSRFRFRALLSIFVCQFAWNPFPLFAAPSSRGTSSGSILLLPVGGREVALGQTGCSYAKGADATHWNSASLGGTRTSEVLFSHARVLSELAFTSLSVAIPWRKESGLGLSVDYLDAGSIDRVDDAGAITSTFNPRDYVAMISGGFPMGFLRVGLNGKYVSSKIINSASTYSGGLALLVPLPQQKIRLGLTADNLIGHLKYNEQEDPLPITFRAGITKGFGDRFMATFETLRSPDQNLNWAGGAEMIFGRKDRITAALRLGYNNALAADKDEFSGFSFGEGLRWKNLSFDYAWAPMGELGLTQYLTMSVDWPSH